MTFDPNEKDLDNLNRGRLMRAESDLMLPMLNKQRENAIAGICNSFREGKLEMLPVYAASLVSIENMKSEIKITISKATILEEKIYGSKG